MTIPGFCCLCLPSPHRNLGMTDAHFLASGIFYEFLGFQTRSSCLSGEDLTHWAISLAPRLILFPRCSQGAHHCHSGYSKGFRSSRPKLWNKDQTISLLYWDQLRGTPYPTPTSGVPDTPAHTISVHCDVALIFLSIGSQLLKDRRHNLLSFLRSSLRTPWI